MLGYKGTYDLKMLELTQYLIKLSKGYTHINRSVWVKAKPAVAFSQVDSQSLALFL
jgi:hypothetical protein